MKMIIASLFFIKFVTAAGSTTGLNAGSTTEFNAGSTTGLNAGSTKGFNDTTIEPGKATPATEDTITLILICIFVVLIVAVIIAIFIILKSRKQDVPTVQRASVSQDKRASVSQVKRASVSQGQRASISQGQRGSISLGQRASKGPSKMQDKSRKETTPGAYGLERKASIFEPEPRDMGITEVIVLEND
ncbi:hypothetical protein BsWGS_13212 [Bradybaena similaris]